MRSRLTGCANVRGMTVSSSTATINGIDLAAIGALAQ